MLKEYENGEEGEDEEEEHHSDDDSDEAPELITSREDFEGMVDEFLNDYEILGRKMRPKLEGETGAEKLGTFREAIGIDERVRIQQVDDDSEPEEYELVEEEKKDRWDCETILCKAYFAQLSTLSLTALHSDVQQSRKSSPVDSRKDFKTCSQDYSRPTNRSSFRRRS